VRTTPSGGAARPSSLCMRADEEAEEEEGRGVAVVTAGAGRGPSPSPSALRLIFLIAPKRFPASNPTNVQAPPARRFAAVHLGAVGGAAVRAAVRVAMQAARRRGTCVWRVDGWRQQGDLRSTIHGEILSTKIIRHSLGTHQQTTWRAEKAFTENERCCPWSCDALPQPLHSACTGRALHPAHSAES